MNYSINPQKSQTSGQAIAHPLSRLETAIDRRFLRVGLTATLMEVIGLMSSSTVSNASASQASPQEVVSTTKRSSYALVMVEDQLVGILTERDVVKLTARGVNDLANILVTDVMTRQLITLQEDELQHPFAALNIFRQHRIRHLPILNQQNQVVGVVTPTSIRSTLQSTDLFRLRRVEEVMSHQVIEAVGETTVLELAQMMAAHRVSCVVITRSDESTDGSTLTPIGIVTERDIVQLQALGLNLSTLNANAIMSSPLLCLNLQDNLWTAHQTMEQLRVRRLVVTNEQGTLAGIVTQTSILAALDPLELHNTIALLQQQVEQLQDERMQWLQARSAQLENQVEATERRFHAIFNQTFQFIGLLELDGTVIEANQTALDFSGLQREDVVGRPFWEIRWWSTAPETQADLKCAIARAAQGEFIRYEVEVLGADRIATIDFSLRPMLDDQGRVVLLIPEGRDISERVQLEAERLQAEVALCHSEQRYANLAQAAPVGIFQTDAYGNCLYVNDLWCQIAGMTPDMAKGLGWLQGIHPEDREYVMTEWYCAAQAGQAFQLEYRFQTPVGHVTWVFGQAVAEFEPGGQMSGHIGTITDITERKYAEAALQASEARLKEAQHIAHLGSWELDLTTNTLIWSDEIYRIFELNPEQFGATYEAFLKAIHPDDLDLVNQAYTDSISNRTPYALTHRLRMADGRIKYVHERCQTFYAPDGRPIRSLGTVQDVTARKQIENALHYQLAQAQLMNQISTRFSNLASGDLDAGIQLTLYEIAEFTQMDMGFLIQLTQAHQTFELTYAWAIEPSPHAPETQHLSVSTLPWMMAQAHQCEMLCIPDFAELPIEAAIDVAYWQALGVNTLFAIPIRYLNDAIGWIGCASLHLKKPCLEVPTPEQKGGCFFQSIELVSLVGEIFAHALHRKNTEAELYRHQNHLEDLVVVRTAELQESEARFRTMADTAPVLIWISGVDQSCTYFNQGWLTFTGRTLEQELGNGWVDGVHPDDVERCLTIYVTAFEARQPFEMDYRLRRFDGEYRWILDIGTPRFLSNGEFAGYIGSCLDITERRQIEQDLYREKELAQVTLHSIGDAVITTNALGQVEYINPVAEQLTGWSASRACGRWLTEVFNIIHEVTREPTENPVERVLREGCVAGLANHTVLISQDGSEYSIEDSAAPIRDRTGQMIGAVMVFHDVTQSRQLAHQLSWQASHDTLTGLVNRRQFEHDLTDILQHLNQWPQVHVLCYLDLDQFKVVNDTCGHMAGDGLLRQVSRLLKDHIRATDTLARLGGDEFGILLKQCPLERAEHIANQIRKAIQNFRFLWQDKTFSIGVSIGLVALDSDNHTLADVLSAADAACYAAKDRGRNRVHVYQVDDSELLRQRGERQWSVRIKQALEDNRFCLYHQAIAHTTTVHQATPVHYEILLRMIDEQGELILPGAFIPAAERYNLMPDIDRWVIRTFFAYLERAQRHMISLPSLLPQPLYLINLSGASVGDAQFLSFLKEQFAQYAISPHFIGFEITETTAISSLEQATHFMHELKQLGCCFALDDFGSGMSSFGYLKTLPVDYLKIDGKFICEIGDDPATYAIVESINHVGHVMGLKTIAESVESPTLRKQLAKIGIDYVQGYSIDSPRFMSMN